MSPASVQRVFSGYVSSGELTVTGQRVREDTCSRICHCPGGLLQHGTRSCTKVCDRPTPTCAERCGTSRQWHAQVWPWTVADFACWLALARCGRSSSVQAQFTGVYTTKHRSTCRTAASLSPTSPLVSDCAQHFVASWLYHVINAAHSVVARFLSPDQSSGTRFQMNWETTLKTLALGVHWKHCSSVSISVFSALEVYLYTTMRYINWHFTYLLTYLLSCSFRFYCHC